MPTTHGGGGTDVGPGEPPGDSDGRLGSVGATLDSDRRCRYSTGVGSLLATLVLLVVAYPTLQSLVQPLQILASTAIVVVGVTVWATSWLALELVLVCQTA